MKNSGITSPRTAQKRTESSVFTFDSGVPFANNDEYASKGLIFDILAVSFEAEKGYEGSDRWALRVKAQDREVEMMTLGSNPGRDEQMRAAQAFLDGQGAILNVRLKKSRNAFYFENAAGTQPT